MTTEGFEPSPFQNSALNYRLRPLGQIVIVAYLPKKNIIKQIYSL